jgi:RNA polymerase sigma-70 factor (ECF subfamily)
MMSDKKWLSEVKRGSERAFKLLYRKYKAMVYSIALRSLQNREDARDITQETFIRVFKNIDKIYIDRPLKNYLLTIESHLIVDRFRKNLPECELKHDLPAVSSTVDSIEKEEVVLRIENAIAKLPRHYRLPLLLRIREGISYSEIAKMLDITPGDARIRVMRARNFIKKEVSI